MKSVPTILFDILSKVSGDEHTFMIQDMAQELFIKIFEVGMDTLVQ